MMVRNAEQTAKSAETSTSNGVGMCLQWSRQRAEIGALFPDASTAWRNAIHRHKQGSKDWRKPPRGAMCYWTGGSKGYGHIAVSLGGGRIRSSDAGGNGRPATVDLDWPTRTWGMPYAGWADNVNDVAIPGVGGKPQEDDMETQDQITKWTPTKGSQGQISVGKTLNQSRGYAEDTYQRIDNIEKKLNNLQQTINKIAKATGAK